MCFHTVNVDYSVCSFFPDYNCLESEAEQITIDTLDEPDDPNYSPILEVAATARNRIPSKGFIHHYHRHSLGKFSIK